MTSDFIIKAKKEKANWCKILKCSITALLKLRRLLTKFDQAPVKTNNVSQSVFWTLILFLSLVTAVRNLVWKNSQLLPNYHILRPIVYFNCSFPKHYWSRPTWQVNWHAKAQKHSQIIKLNYIYLLQQIVCSNTVYHNFRSKQRQVCNISSIWELFLVCHILLNSYNVPHENQANKGLTISGVDTDIASSLSLFSNFRRQNWGKIILKIIRNWKQLKIL